MCDNTSKDNNSKFPKSQPGFLAPGNGVESVRTVLKYRVERGIQSIDIRNLFLHNKQQTYIRSSFDVGGNLSCIVKGIMYIKNTFQEIF